MKGTAIVTGAGKRVGAVIAQALVADGWSVIAHVHSEDDTVPEGAAKVVADLEVASCAQAIFSASSRVRCTVTSSGSNS